MSFCHQKFGITNMIKLLIILSRLMNWKYNYQMKWKKSFYDSLINISFCRNILPLYFIFLNTLFRHWRMFLSTCFNMNKQFWKTCLINKLNMKGAEKSTLSWMLRALCNLFSFLENPVPQILFCMCVSKQIR